MAKGFGKDPVISLRLPKEEIKSATHLAKQRGVSRSKLIRQLLTQAPVLWPMTQSDQPVHPVNSGGSR